MPRLVIDVIMCYFRRRVCFYMLLIASITTIKLFYQIKLFRIVYGRKYMYI